ncbi:MAG: NTP transferase domain-containing protein [candidate division WOR-3 bacterium]|nr:NTP transferase domain-containing protein [candidate division WOR-3 bacterium]
MTGIILAAGKSKRMGLNHSKVLLPLKGRPVLAWIIELAQKASLNPIIVVISPNNLEIKDIFSDYGIQFVIQPEAKGTADAVRVCAPLLSVNDDILVLYGDVPLLKLSTIKELIEVFYREKADATILTAILDNPSSYGRIVRNEQQEIIAIIEHKDAGPEIQKINEINTGVYAFRFAKLKPILDTLPASSKDGEYYLTSALTEIIKQGGKVNSVRTKTPEESFGINTPEEWERVKKLFNTQCD